MTQPNDVHVYIVDLKASVPELVTENEDGSYTVLLNARYNYEHQQESFRHACGHIENHDFEKTDVQMIENEAHEREKK